MSSKSNRFYDYDDHDYHEKNCYEDYYDEDYYDEEDYDDYVVFEQKSKISVKKIGYKQVKI